MTSMLVRNKSELVIIGSLLSFWPVINWYWIRMLDSSDDNFGLLALVTALGLVFLRRGESRSQVLPVMTITLLMLVYLISLFLLPPILRAAIAMTLIAVLLSHIYMGRRMQPGLWGLLILSLPVMASVQFYLGYPLRWIVGFVAEKLLQLNGLAVSHSGTVLNWSGGTVSIDAPCSGVKMLWFGFYLCFTLACLYRLSPVRLVALGTITSVVIVAANSLRATALFYTESGLIAMPGWAHNGIGIVMFIAAAILVVYSANRLNPRVVSCDV
ncbi:MAG: exosortase/archaeosortase family protein [Gammaproteobacteria bacterium]|nr:exosortase/archaeosortase family protein [Gammaproteobacteria bacterium]